MDSLESVRMQISTIKRKLIEKNIQLNSVLSENEVTEFETTHGIQLPLEYRLFLQEVGNGGAGPYYGLIPLHRAEIDFVKKEDLENQQKTERFEGKFIQLSHEGCGYYYVLVLTGEEQGNIWNDSRAADYGLHKIRKGFGHYTLPYRFLDWYEHWIDSGAKGMKDWFPEL